MYVWPSGATLIDGGLINWNSSPKVNDEGLVAAAAWDESEGEECGFVWDTRTGSRKTIGLGVIPSDVNGNGWVTGVWVDGDVRHAFVWDSTSGLVDLGARFDGSHGLAINDHGQVIGGASRGEDSDGRWTSFLWDPNAGLIELPPLRTEDSTIVAGINDSGTVVGVSGPLVWDGQSEQMGITEGEPVIWSPTK